MMMRLDGCQIPGYPRAAEGVAGGEQKAPVQRLKAALARPWNYTVKPLLKLAVRQVYNLRESGRQVGSERASASKPAAQPLHLAAGEAVRVRSREQIEATLDPFKELKGCAFLETMWQYCETTQRVLQPVERFLDERDYKVKKTRGIVLLEGVLCSGTPVFGRCDRACHLFWREEWLERVKLDGTTAPTTD